MPCAPPRPLAAAKSSSPYAVRNMGRPENASGETGPMLMNEYVRPAASAVECGSRNDRYRSARARARAKVAAEAKNELRPRGQEEADDTNLVAKKARDIGDRLEGLSKIKRECTNVKNSSEKIRGVADEVQSQIKADAGEIVDLLGGR